MHFGVHFVEPRFVGGCRGFVLEDQTFSKLGGILGENFFGESVLLPADAPIFEQCLVL